MPQTLALGQVALLLVASAGCAAKTAPSVIPERVRSELGAVAVIAPPAPPGSSLSYPVPSRAGAALTGASAALGVGAVAGAACFGTLGLVWPACLIAIWTPVMVVTGVVEGASKGVPLADLRASAAALKDAVGEPDLGRRFAERVATEAQRRVGEGRVRFAADAMSDVVSPRPDTDGVDTVLEVRLEQLALERTAGSTSSSYGPSFSVERLIDAPLALTVKAHARVLRAADGTTLYERTFTQRAGSQKFTEWGREDAAEFRRERDRALEAVAEEIASHIFGPAPLSSESAPPRVGPEGRVPVTVRREEPNAVDLGSSTLQPRDTISEPVNGRGTE